MTYEPDRQARFRYRLTRLSRTEWWELRQAIEPFLHADDPSVVGLPSVSDQLEQHTVVMSLEEYRSTGDHRWLDRAGRALVPTRAESFGWYVALTK